MRRVGSRRPTVMTWRLDSMALPERSRKGTPCHRQLSISTLRATSVSVVEPGATPSSSWYPSYWPRTTLSSSIGRRESKTLLFSSRRALAVSDEGGSMATMPSTWNRWVTTMSRKAPVAS